MERVPASFLYPQPEVEFEDPGTPGYVIELDGGMEIADADVPGALELFWRNHLALAGG
jgi:hypothetical protein